MKIGLDGILFINFVLVCEGHSEKPTSRSSLVTDGVTSRGCEDGSADTGSDCPTYARDWELCNDETHGAFMREHCANECKQVVDNFCDNSVAPTCDDKKLNQEEEKVDCGGPNCAACAAETCVDGKINQNEVGIDCGGVCGDKGSGSISDYAQSQLQKHNELRAKHNSAEMTLDNCLIADAERWATNLANAGKWLSQSDHDDDRGNQGENLGISCSSGEFPKYEDVTDNWYSEEADYNYKKGESKNGNAIGHFTQVVWKSSTKLGIGKAFGKVKKDETNWNCTWAVARYAPTGNVKDQYIVNVEQPKSN